MNCNARLRHAYGITVRFCIPKRKVKAGGTMPRIQGGRIGKRTVERLCVSRTGKRFSGTGTSPASESGSIRRVAKVYVVQSRGQRAIAADHPRTAQGALRGRGSASGGPYHRPNQDLGRTGPGDGAPPSITVSELAGRYLREHVAVHCKPRTRVLYEATVRRHLVPALGDTDGLGRSPRAGHLPALPAP